MQLSKLAKCALAVIYVSSAIRTKWPRPCKWNVSRLQKRFTYLTLVSQQEFLKFDQFCASLFSFAISSAQTSKLFGDSQRRRFWNHISIEKLHCKSAMKVDIGNKTHQQSHKWRLKSTNKHFLLTILSACLRQYVVHNVFFIKIKFVSHWIDADWMQFNLK